MTPAVSNSPAGGEPDAPSLTYTTREGAEWILRAVVPDAHVRGFYWGRRAGDGQLVCVHEHRCVFHPAEQQLRSADNNNPA